MDIPGQASPSDDIFEESDLDQNDESMAGPSGIQEQNNDQIEMENFPANVGRKDNFFLKIRIQIK